MGLKDVDQIFLCPGCLYPAEGPGSCADCGTKVIECRPGEADDPCRRPLMDDKGLVLTRAPIWWLQYRVGALMKHLEKERN